MKNINAVEIKDIYNLEVGDEVTIVAKEQYSSHDFSLIFGPLFSSRDITILIREPLLNKLSQDPTLEISFEEITGLIDKKITFVVKHEINHISLGSLLPEISEIIIVKRSRFLRILKQTKSLDRIKISFPNHESVPYFLFECHLRHRLKIEGIDLEISRAELYDWIINTKPSTFIVNIDCLLRTDDCFIKEIISKIEDMVLVQN